MMGEANASWQNQGKGNRAMERIRRRSATSLSVLSLIFAVQSYASVDEAPEKEAVPEVVSSLGAQSCVENAKWLLPNRQQAQTTAQFIPTLTNKRVVLLGEFHDSNAHHLWQLQTMSALFAMKGDVAIGLEMLPVSAQPVLDKWVAGELSLDEFLKATKWYEYWKFDIEYYLPILEFARINKIPLYGLNVDKSLVQSVSKNGWDKVPVEERAGITDPAPPSETYLELLAASFAMHGPGGAAAGHGEVKVDMEAMNKDPKFQRFVQGQQLWDRGMAHTIQTIYNKSETTQIIAIMGSGHVMNGLGVPHQLADLGVKDVSVLIPWDGSDGCEMITSDVADAVFGVKELPPKERDKPKLGVVIETTKQGVIVNEVVDNSIAAGIGIKKGDYIVEVAGVAYHEVMGVIEAVQQTPPGRWLPLVIKRGEERIDFVAKFPPEKASVNSPK